MGDVLNEADHHNKIVVEILHTKRAPSAFFRHMKRRMKTVNQPKKMEHVLTYVEDLRLLS